MSHDALPICRETLAAVFHGHRCEKPEGGVLEDGGKLFVLLPDAVLVVAKDYDAGLGTVVGEVLAALNGHDAHGGNGFGNAHRNTKKAALLLKGDLDIGVLGNETILLLHVGIVSGGAVNKILMEGLGEERRRWSYEIAR